MNQTLPGPADYYTESQRTIKGGKIGETKRILMSKKSIDPSPQSYSPQFKFIKKRNPKFVFPSGRKALIIKPTPGPAEKNIQDI